MRTRSIPCILLAILLITALLLALTGCFSQLTITEFDSIDDYGKIIGNGSDRRAQEMFDEMFPEKIEDYFDEPVYHYIAFYGVDARAFEIALEFTIKDTETFNAFVEKAAAGKDCEVFPYDETYQCYTISSPWMFLDDEAPCTECENRPTHYHIGSADIELMLVQPDTQCIIFVGLGVSDGGGVDTYDLGWFFDRFGIDPTVYEAENTWRAP